MKEVSKSLRSKIKPQTVNKDELYEKVRFCAYVSLYKKDKKINNIPFLQFNDLDQHEKGLKDLYLLFADFKIICNHDAYIVKNVAFDRINVYYAAFNSFLEQSSSFLKSDELSKGIRDYFVFSVLHEVESFVEHLKVKFETKNVKLIFNLLDVFREFAVQSDYFSISQVIALGVCQISTIVKSQQLEKTQESELNKLIDKIYFNIQKNILDYEFDTSIQVPKEQFNMLCTVQLHERNCIIVAEVLGTVILNIEQNFIDLPIEYEVHNAAYFELLKLNWNSLISILKNHYDMDEIHVKPGYSQVADKLKKIERKFESEYNSYANFLKSKMNCTKKKAQLKADCEVITIKINVLKQVVEILKNSHSAKSRENKHEIDKIMQKVYLLKEKCEQSQETFSECLKKKEKLSNQKGNLLDQIVEENKRSKSGLLEINKRFSKLKQTYEEENNSNTLLVQNLNKLISGLKDENSILKAKLPQIEKNRNQLELQNKNKVKKIKHLQATLSLEDEKLIQLHLQKKECLKESQYLDESNTKMTIELEQLISDIKTLEIGKNKKVKSYEEMTRVDLKRKIEDLHNKLKNKQIKLNELEKNHEEFLIKKNMMAEKVNNQRNINNRLFQELTHLKKQLVCFEQLGIGSLANRGLVTPDEYLKKILTEKRIKLKSIEINILEYFNKSSTEINSFIFGGRVRDALLNKPSRDVDIVLFVPAKFFEQFKQDKLKSFHKTLYFDNHWQKKIIHNGEEYCFDISIFASDLLMKFGEVPMLKINALMVDSFGRVYDANKGGVEEILNPQHYPCIGVIGNPDERIQRDPFRIVRVIGISARLNRKIDDNLWEVIKDQAYRICEFPLGKYLSALDKLFNHKAGPQVLQILFKRLGVLRSMFSFLGGISDSKIQGYQTFLMTQLCLVNSDEFRCQNQGFHVNNAYLALLLFPVFDQIKSEQEHLKGPQTIDVFLRGYKGRQPENGLEKKVLTTVNHCLVDINKAYNGSKEIKKGVKNN